MCMRGGKNCLPNLQLKFRNLKIFLTLFFADFRLQCGKNVPLLHLNRDQFWHYFHDQLTYFRWRHLQNDVNKQNHGLDSDPLQSIYSTGNIWFQFEICIQCPIPAQLFSVIMLSDTHRLSIQGCPIHDGCLTTELSLIVPKH